MRSIQTSQKFDYLCRGEANAFAVTLNTPSFPRCCGSLRSRTTPSHSLCRVRWANILTPLTNHDRRIPILSTQLLLSELHATFSRNDGGCLEALYPHLLSAVADIAHVNRRNDSAEEFARRTREEEAQVVGPPITWEEVRSTWPGGAKGRGSPTLSRCRRAMVAETKGRREGVAEVESSSDAMLFARRSLTTDSLHLQRKWGRARSRRRARSIKAAGVCFPERSRMQPVLRLILSASVLIFCRFWL